MSEQNEQGPQPGQQGPPPGYQWAPIPPAKKKRHWFRNSVLGLSAFIVVMIVAGSMSGGSDGTSTASDPGSKTAAKKASKKMAAIGTPARDGKFEFTVTDVKAGKTHVGDATFGSDAQGEYVIVSVTVKNIGDKAQMLDASSQKAYDAAGHEYSADGGAGISLDSKTFLNDINPGNAVEGKVVFDVPKGTKLDHLELHDSPFSGGVKIAL